MGQLTSPEDVQVKLSIHFLANQVILALTSGMTQFAHVDFCSQKALYKELCPLLLHRIVFLIQE